MVRHLTVTPFGSISVAIHLLQIKDFVARVGRAKVELGDLYRSRIALAKTGGKPGKANAISYRSIGGIVSKETVCCVGGKVKH